MKKKNKEKIFEMIESCLFICTGVVFFKPMTWQHLKETAVDSCFCGTNMKQTSLFTLGEIKTCQVIRNKYRLYKLLFLQPRDFSPLIGSKKDQKPLACKDDSNHKHTFIFLTLYFFNIIVEKSIAIRITPEFLSL